MTSSAAARPTSGWEPAPRPSVAVTPIWMMRSAFDSVSAWASVLATTKSTPCSPALIMLLTALPPAPPTPNTVIRGFNSLMSGIFRLMLMGASCWGGACRRLPPVRHRRCKWSARRLVACRTHDRLASVSVQEVGPASETFPQPSSDAGDIAARFGSVLPRMPRLEVFEMRGLGINQKPGQGGKRRPLGAIRQARDAERAAERDRAAQDTAGKVGEPRQQAAAAGQDHPPTRLRRERRGH